MEQSYSSEQTISNTSDYNKTPQLSNIINKYKTNRSEFLIPPPPKQRGNLTTLDLIQCETTVELIAKVREWATEVFQAFGNHHIAVSTIASIYLNKYKS